MRQEYDAIIVGARCAGAAVAMLLARRGLRVLAVDRSRYGSDTLSTHALMRGGVLQLHRWGVLDAVRSEKTTPIRSTSFHYDDEAVTVPIEPRDGVDALYAPRRTVLDRILVDAARGAGATVRHGVRVDDLLRSRAGRVEGAILDNGSGRREEVRARLVIGADGARSGIARRVGAQSLRAGSHATSVIFGYWTGIEQDGNHWHYRPGVAAGRIPTTGDQTCVFVAMPPERFRREVAHGAPVAYRRALEELDADLAAAVAAARGDGKLRTFAGQVGHLRRSHGPGWALVGDAGYFKDPLTAHGMTDALRDAELLARAVEAGTDADLARYQEERDDLSIPFFDVTDRVASFAWSIDEVRQHHLRMSREMKREVATLLALDPAPQPA